MTILKEYIVHHWYNFFYISDFPKDGPKITTIPLGRNEYRVGDTAHLMCRAQKSSPPTELSWYINGEPVSAAHQYYIYINVDLFDKKNFSH